MSWFRFGAIIFVVWGIAFLFLAPLSNEIFANDYETVSPHAEDWTRLLGVSLFAIAFLLNAAHVSPNDELKRTVARGVLILTLGIALIVTYWQIIPDGLWNRLDIINLVLLFLISYGLFRNSGLLHKK